MYARIWFIGRYGSSVKDHKSEDSSSGMDEGKTEVQKEQLAIFWFFSICI